MLWWFVKREKTARIVRVAASRAVLAEVAKVGVSAMLMQVLTLVQQAIIYRAAAEWGGAEWQVLFGAALRIQSFAFIPLWGMSNGFQPAAGTNYGAGLYDRVRRCTVAFSLGATGLALLFWIPAMLFPEAALSLFITDPALVAQGVDDFRVFFVAYLAMGVMVMGITLFQSLGKGGLAALLALARPLLLFVPLVLIVPNLGGLGIHGVWLACAITDGLLALIAVALMVRTCRGMGKGRARAAAIEEGEAARA